MLTKIYRAIMLAQASSAANRTAAYLSDHQLNDWGYTRGSFAAAMVAQVKADFDAADKAAHPTTSLFNSATILQVIKKDEFHSFHPLAFF